MTSTRRPARDVPADERTFFGQSRQLSMLSPVGLSVATKLAPERFQTQMVALFSLSVALGTGSSGLLAEFYDPKNEVPYFSVLGLVAVAAGALLLVIARPAATDAGRAVERTA